jgi:glutathione synthase/RimK-type ligase-like ATP-grasp enzyme
VKVSVSSRPAILLLTGANYPDLAPDDQLLADAFRAAGWSVRIQPWQEPAPDADFAIVRSCWDYLTAPDRFVATLEALAERMPLWNPLETIRWNLDKRYLVDLAAAGAPVPTTRVIPAGEAPALDEVLDALASDDLVLKPVIGAGGEDTWRIGRGNEALWAAAAGRFAALVQPFLPEVLTAGEVSLTYLDGAYSHAVVKHAAPGEFRVQEEHGGRVSAWQAPSDVVAACDAVLAGVSHPWRYARVDGILTRDGFRLMELELVEPELFFRWAPRAADTFVRATSR